MIKVKYLIIGAGVSGLGFANFINSKDFLILEKESEPGGYCRTICKDGFIWDYAGHFFHFVNEDLKDFFNRKINQEDIIYKRKNTKIFYKGKYIDYPFQKNIHQLPKNEFIDCLYDLFNKEEKEQYSGFEDMLYGKFGKSITEKFLKPYNEKLYACNLNDLDVDAMGRFFPYANVKEIIDNMKIEEDTSYNKDFLYPKKGAITFVNALLKEVDKEKVLYNQEVVKIDLETKIVRTKDQSIKYQYLINSSPFDKLVRYVDEGEFIKNKDKLTYNKVLVFNLGFNKKSHIEDIHWIYVPDKEINFYRLGFYDNILDANKLSMYVEIGYSADDEVEVNKQLKHTLENLKKMKIIDDHELIAYSSVIMNPAYVHISEVAKKIKEDKKREFEVKDLYSIGRYGDWKYCSIEDSLLDAIKLAKKLEINN
jgi:protoporphyrinogen oxidase